eukprot:c14153_g1_i1 orf=230-1798(-)
MEKPSIENGGRPGKTVACPRCQSLNTKFCYYNNHNVNQPRHFCRDCQRYWTAGGSLRNVPVGAGKRKHKGPHPIGTRIDNLPNIFCFSGTNLDQGVYATPPLDPPSVLSFKQHVSHSYGENKLSEMPAIVSQKAVGGERKPPVTPTSQPLVSASCGEMNAAETRGFVCPRPAENVGFSDMVKKPSLNLGLTLSKETDVKESDAKLPSHSNNPRDFTSSHHVTKQDAHRSTPHDFSPSHHVAKQDTRPPQHVNERDESTGCSSVTANLGPSMLEAFAESNTPSTRAPTLPTVEQAQQAPGVLNPMTAWGASMCPPWLWPFMMSGQNVVPPAGVPQVDPTFAAAMGAMAGMPAMGAMASMPPIHPAFAAAMGAMASGGRMPQVDPNIMAAVTAASFLHLPHLWNPYAWGLPWNAAWNMTNAGVNAPNGINKRPVSPTQEQGCASKSVKRDHPDEAAHSTGDVSNATNFPCPAGYFDAFQPKADAFQCKPTGTQQSEERSDLHQHQPPHTNPAAQARSAAFQEGN